MMRYNTGFAVEHVFVSHLHGDHVLGLPGLVQTWDFNDREDPLAIHAPPRHSQSDRRTDPRRRERPRLSRPDPPGLAR